MVASDAEDEWHPASSSVRDNVGSEANRRASRCDTRGMKRAHTAPQSTHARALHRMGGKAAESGKPPANTKGRSCKTGPKIRLVAARAGGVAPRFVFGNGRDGYAPVGRSESEGFAGAAEFVCDGAGCLLACCAPAAQFNRAVPSVCCGPPSNSRLGKIGCAAQATRRRPTSDTHVGTVDPANLQDTSHDGPSHTDGEQRPASLGTRFFLWQQPEQQQSRSDRPSRPLQKQGRRRRRAPHLFRFAPTSLACRPAAPGDAPSPAQPHAPRRRRATISPTAFRSMATLPSPLVSPATPWFPCLGAAMDDPHASPSLRRPSSSQRPWGWQHYEPASPPATLRAAPRVRSRSPSNATLESPVYDLPLASLSLNARPSPRSPPARPLQPEPLRIPSAPKRSISMNAAVASSLAPAPPLQRRASTEPIDAPEADLADPEDLSLFAQAMTGLDGGFMGPEFGQNTTSPAGLGASVNHPQSAGPTQTHFGFGGPLADRHDTLTASRPPVTSHSQPSSRMPTPDFTFAQPATTSHYALPYHPPAAAHSQPVAPAFAPAPVYAPASIRIPTHAEASSTFAAELARLEDRPPDDELPDYATSQREAAQANRMQASQRAQELERRWTAARFGRRRG